MHSEKVWEESLWGKKVYKTDKIYNLEHFE